MFQFSGFSDHVQLPADKPDTSKNVKQQILGYLQSQNVKLSNPKIYLLLHQFKDFGAPV